jgi:hypothetical protein
MTYLLILLSLVAFSSCSFKSPDEKKANQGVSQYEEIKPEDLAKMDTDGDRINDLEEKEKGLNPFVADIPELRIRFLQDFEIFLNIHPPGKPDNGWVTSISTKTGRNDPDFQYRVGEIFVREKAFEESAKVGKFATHIMGEIKASDLTWVKYPQIDPNFMAREILSLEEYFRRGSVGSAFVEIENTVKLEPNSLYKSVKNLELNFYYYDYEKETYELLETKKVERTFLTDVTETFKVEIQNIPLNLIEDNFFKKGEFIISEVKDFEIPDLGIKYSELMKTVKDKTVQIIVSHPLDIKNHFVAPFKGKKRLNDLLNHIFEGNFAIQDNKLNKLLQFENSLPGYTYLEEVKSLDKQGKWFILTDQINRGYLDYDFKEGDSIAVTYVTGKELASQTKEKQVAIKMQASGENDYRIHPLGYVSPNSKVDLILAPGFKSGDKLERLEDRPSSAGGSCGRNCSAREFYCHLQMNVFKKRDRPEGFQFKKDFSEELGLIYLMVNQDEFPLKQLVEEKKVAVNWKNGMIHITINEIGKIKPIFEYDDNVLALKLVTHVETTWDGIKLISYSGKQGYTCWELTAAMAYNMKWPVSKSSKDIDQWGRWFNWNVLKLADDRVFIDTYDISVVSTINNFYN